MRSTINTGFGLNEEMLYVMQLVLSTAPNLFYHDENGECVLVVGDDGWTIHGEKYDIIGFKVLTPLWCTPSYELYVRSMGDEFGKFIISDACLVGKFERIDDVGFRY